MNTLYNFPHAFEAWWNTLPHPSYVKEEARRGWEECFLESHKVNNRASKLRGIGSYCSGWNAAVEFILMRKFRHE